MANHPRHTARHTNGAMDEMGNPLRPWGVWDACLEGFPPMSDHNTEAEAVDAATWANVCQPWPKRVSRAA